MRSCDPSDEIVAHPGSFSCNLRDNNLPIGFCERAQEKMADTANNPSSASSADVRAGLHQERAAAQMQELIHGAGEFSLVTKLGRREDKAILSIVNARRRAPAPSLASVRRPEAPAWIPVVMDYQQAYNCPPNGDGSDSADLTEEEMPELVALGYCDDNYREGGASTVGSTSEEACADEHQERAAVQRQELVHGVDSRVI